MQIKSDIFLFLGMDLTLEVVRYLDNSSVVAFLNAIPRLKPAAVLLTDHLISPMHFNIKGVTRKYIMEPAQSRDSKTALAPPDLRYFSPLRDRQQIRLIELTMPWTEEIVFYCANHVPQMLMPLNNTSFLYLPFKSGIEIDSNKPHSMLENVDGLDDIDLKLVIGTSTLFEEKFDLDYFKCVFLEEAEERRLLDESDLSYGQVLKYNRLEGLPDIYNSLETLRVETNTLCGDIYMPNLVQFCVVFSCLDDEIPLLQKITAPKLVQFVVHYNNLPPLFKGIDVGGDASASRVRRYPNIREFTEGYNDLDAGIFEMAHIPSLQVNRAPYLETPGPVNCDLKLYDSSDMSFTKAYLVHNYIGVPTSLFRVSDYSEVAILRWHISKPESTVDGTLLDLSEVVELHIYMTGKGTRIPLLGACQKMEKIVVEVLDLNVDISSIWRAGFPSLRSFTLYQPESLIKTSEFKTSSIKVSNKEWEMFMMNTGPKPWEIKLSGFEMPFFYSPMDKVITSTYTIHVRPVIPKGSTEFTLKLFTLKPSIPSRGSLESKIYINIDPIFADTSDKGKVNLVLVGELHDQVIEISVCTPTLSWSDVFFRRHKLLKRLQSDSWAVKLFKFGEDLELQYDYRPEIFRVRW